MTDVAAVECVLLWDLLDPGDHAGHSHLVVMGDGSTWVQRPADVHPHVETT